MDYTANMGVLRVDHPDIIEFIKCKDDENKFNNFNISVGITDEFMDNLKNGLGYPLINPRTGEIARYESTQDIWDLIIEQAHKNGEPGVVFLDEINRKHPLPDEIEGVNVCGEQPLLPYEQCVLGAINLANMIKPSTTEETRNTHEMDWEKLDKTVRLAVRFLDNCIDANDYPIQEIEEMAKKNRKIGIGVMGWAEMLIKLNFKYDSEHAVEFAKYVSKIINNTAISESEKLAEEKGEFPNFDNSDIEITRRNAVLTTVAPTGSRSIIANTTGGIEPFFDFDYTHTDKDDNVSEFKYDFTEEADEDVLVTAKDISPEWHIRMQAAWQENIGSSISKTINMPASATVEDVDNAYRLAYELGCKGITIYRDGSRSEQVLNSDDDKETKSLSKTSADTNKCGGFVQKAKERAKAERFKMQTGCGTMYLIVVFDDNGDVIELFTETKNGGCKSSTEALSRMNSLALRGGIPIDEVIDQLLSVSPCVSYQTAKAKGKDVSPGTSCPHAVGLKLKQVMEEQMDEVAGKFITGEEGAKTLADKCPECGKELKHQSGCVVCECGYSKCG